MYDVISPDALVGFILLSFLDLLWNLLLCDLKLALLLNDREHSGQLNMLLTLQNYNLRKPLPYIVLEFMLFLS